MSVLAIFVSMKGKIPVRQRILATAGKLFYEQGYNSTGINQLIAESAVAKASFYDHFPAKEDLCVAYLSADSDSWLAAMQSQLQDKESIKEKLTALFDHVIQFSRDNHYRGCAFLNVLSEVGSSSPKISAAVQQHKMRLLALFREITAAEPSARQVYLLYESALMECQVFAESWPAEQAKETALQLINH